MSFPLLTTGRAESWETGQARAQPVPKAGGQILEFPRSFRFQHKKAGSLLCPGSCPAECKDLLSPSISLYQVFSLSTQLQEKGVYKAMNEFDIFINCIEEYMTIKMKS